MITLNGVVGKQLRIPLFSSDLATGLALSGLTFDAALNGEYISTFTTSYSASLTEIDSSNFAKAYSLAIVPQKEGELILTVYYSSYQQTYVIQVGTQDVSFLAGDIQGAVGDFVFTVSDSSNVAIEGVSVRVFNNAESKLLQTLTTNSSGQVTISAPVGSYKLRLSKSNYSFTNPTSISITANDSAVPQIKELIPSTAASESVIAISGRYFGSAPQVLFGASAVSASSVSVGQDVLLVTVPSLSVSSILIQVRKADPANAGSFLTSSTSLTLSVS